MGIFVKNESEITFDRPEFHLTRQRVLYTLMIGVVDTGPTSSLVAVCFKLIFAHYHYPGVHCELYNPLLK